MRKIYLLAAALFMGVAANAQTDDFESYPLGPYFGGHWSNWSGTNIPAENIMIANDQAVSGTKSGYIGGTGDQDAILVIPMKTTGKVTVRFKMFIEFAATGYFNFQKDLNQLGVSGNWANEWYWGFDPVGEVQEFGAFYYVSGNTAYGPISFTDEEWMDIEMEIDLNANTNRLFVNGGEITTGSGTPLPFTTGAAKINGMDFFSHADTSSYFIDDISITDGGLGVSDLSASEISVYPTVAKDVVNVTAKSNIKNIAVFNTAGQQVSKVPTNGMNAQINVSSLPAGVYMVKIQTDKEVLTKKIVVK